MPAAMASEGNEIRYFAMGVSLVNNKVPHAGTA
jgi:hypothetical protein